MPVRSWLQCGCLGDKLFGKDVDELFAYQTPRIAVIKDRKLGLIRIFLMVSIFFYIFIFNIWYKGAHFSFTPVQGITRLQWQEPTRNHCNPADADCLSDFKDQKDLPYCTGYTGSQPEAVVRDCDYSDARELPIYIMEGVMMPTYIEKYHQKKMCGSHASTCDRKWKYMDNSGAIQSQKGTAKPVNAEFISEVGRYTLLIDHNFKTDKYWLAYDDYKMQGYWKDCDKGGFNCVTKEIACIHSRCKDMEFTKRPSFLDMAHGNYRDWVHPGRSKQKYHIPGRASSQLWYDEDSDDNDLSVGRDAEISLSAKRQTAAKDSPVFSIGNGDVLSLETMLQMAGTQLNESWTDQIDGLQDVRERGVALVVSIEYYNLKRWTLLQPEDPPWYTITIEAMKSHKFKHLYIKNEEADSRDLMMAYGIYFVVKQHGHLAYLDPIMGLVAMTSAMALLAVSSTITDAIMLYVLDQPIKTDDDKEAEPEKFYYNAKYEVSDDYSDINAMLKQRSLKRKKEAAEAASSVS